MSKILIDLRSSFWFIPALTVFAAAALAVAVVELDDRVGNEALATFPRLFGAGAEGTRQLLSAIASSTITVAGVVFSITVVALSLTAAQYSPRVLRNFMRDRANQLVLGIFLGVYVYCLLVLRTIRGGEHAFVPGISTVGAIVLALVGVAFLIFFIHHIAASIQVSEICARVAAETIEAIEADYAKPAGGADEAAKAGLGDARGPWAAISAARTGYVQSIDYGALVEHACANGRVVRLDLAPGDFIVRGETVAFVSGEEADEHLAAAIRRTLAINTYRDIAQDPAFGVQQLVDIALKALSPGVNDTATARTALDYLTSILLELMKHEVTGERRLRDAHGELRVIAASRSIEFFIESTFEAIRRNSTANVDMLLHALRALERIAAGAGEDAHASLSRQIEALREALGAAHYVSGDRRRLLEAIEQAGVALSDSGPH